MSLTLIAGPSVEPVTLAEVKLNARIDGTEFDSIIPALITAARERAELITNRSMIEQTWELVLDAFPSDEIELAWPKVLDIVSVRYVDPDTEVEVTLDAGSYTLDNETLPGYLLPALDTDWPDTLDCANAVRVRFTAGFGADASFVPESIKHWIKATVSLWLRYPEAASEKQLYPYLDSLLDRWRWHWI